jgi:hypothetical protein
MPYSLEAEFLYKFSMPKVTSVRIVISAERDTSQTTRATAHQSMYTNVEGQIICLPIHSVPQLLLSFSCWPATVTRISRAQVLSNR